MRKFGRDCLRFARLLVLVSAFIIFVVNVALSSELNSSIAAVMPYSVPSQAVVPDNWQAYHDNIWKFDLMVPPDWTIQSVPWRDFGVRINSPNLIVDELGQPVRGAFLSISASQISSDTWMEYLQNRTSTATRAVTDEMPVGELKTLTTYGEFNGNEFTERAWFSPTSGSFHVFRFMEAGFSEQYFETGELILESIRIVGDAENYPAPDFEHLGIDLSNFDVSIKHAFQAGQGRIIADQNAGSHTGGDDHALDLCEGSNCNGGLIGQYVIAPANMKLIASRDLNGIDNDPDDFHFFELGNNGSQRLCMSFAHFQIRLPGLTAGKSVPQGALIGTLMEYAAYSHTEHIHMGLYTVSSSLPSCLHTPRTAISFTGNLELDGEGYSPSQSWAQTPVTSTNYPFCATPYEGRRQQSEHDLSPNSDPSDCFGNGTPDDTTPPSATGFSASVIDGRRAEINTSGVQDNSGGNGVREVRFSAKWDGSWHGIGEDSSAPYTLSWDMCSSNVPNGDVELGMEVWDNADNKWVWSYGNPHITKDSACGGSGDLLAGDWWDSDFWMNKYLAGIVNWHERWLWGDGQWPYIFFDWRTDGPKEGWSGDEFSLRIWRNVYFPGGHYEFHTDSDDGVKVYVGGDVVVDHWWGAGSAAGGRYIPEGWHEVKVEYFENTGNAKLYVVWYGPGYPQPDNSNPDGRISSPTHLSAVSSSPLTIWAEAWDDVSGVDYVRFMAHYCQSGDCGWRELGTDGSAPYTHTWNWDSVGEQHVSLAIHVADKSGKVTYDPGGWIEVELDKTNPTAEINSPTEGSYLTSNSVPIIASASDGGSGVGSVQFFVGYDDNSGYYWHELGSDTDGGNGWQWDWNASGVADQRDVSFFVYVYDRAGNMNSFARWANILDRTTPTSQVDVLPANSPPSFTVSWSGTDNASGLASYDVQYQQDGGSWQNWLTHTTETSSTFSGSNDHTYGFRSRAHDLAGHVEAWPSSADVVTTIDGAIPSAPTVNSIDNPDGNGAYTVTWTSVPGANSYQLQEQFNNGAWESLAHPDNPLSVIVTGRADGQWCYQVRVSDNGTIPSEWSNVQCTSVTSRPDLVDLVPLSPFGDLAISPSMVKNTLYYILSLYADHPTYIDGHVRNIGGETGVGYAFPFEVEIDGTNWSSYGLPIPNPGETSSFYDWPVTLTPGEHTITFIVDPDNLIEESNENNNTWEGTFTWRPVDGWWGEYFDNPDLIGEPVIVRDDETIDFNWGTDPPAPYVPADNFSARWTRSLYYEAGDYRCSLTRDDGARLFVDGITVFERWEPGDETNTFDMTLAEGWHDFQLEYYEAYEGARLALSCDQFAELTFHLLLPAVLGDS